MPLQKIQDCPLETGDVLYDLPAAPPNDFLSESGKDNSSLPLLSVKTSTQNSGISVCNYQKAYLVIAADGVAQHPNQVSRLTTLHVSNAAENRDPQFQSKMSAKNQRQIWLRLMVLMTTISL